MTKITKNQFTAMLLITDTFALFCFHGQISLVTVIGFLCGTVIQFIMSLPLVKLYSSGGSVESAGKIVQSVYLVYLLLWGGMLFAMLWKASDVVYIPYENSNGIWGKLLIAGMIALICLYSSATGIKAVSRSAVIAGGAGVISLLIVAVSAMFASDWNNLTATKTSDSLWSEILRSFFISGGLGSFAVFLNFTKGSPLKNTLYYFTGKIILTVAMTVSAILLAGGIMKITEFPVVTAGQLSQPFPVQRIDSLFLIMFAVFAVFSIAVQSLASTELLIKIFPKFKKLRTTSVLAVMIGTAFMFSSENNSLINIIAVGIILFLLPSAILLKRSLAK
ncbi:MAG: hypothetical protein NC177_12165 [Ruminococcus flavefaciens]|nr:hypothetical protein [Ruminococcus flavefaciens]